MHVRSPKVFRQKYHSSIGRFLHALLRNAKNTLSSQREIPLETLCKREQKPNSFGNFNPKQSFVDYGFLVTPGAYEVILNTDNVVFGGNGLADDSVVHFTIAKGR